MGSSQKLFYKNCTVLDWAYLCPELGPVGDSAYIDVEIESELNEENMILDFSIFKKIVKQVIDNEVDHRLIVKCSDIKPIDNKNKVFQVNYCYGKNKKKAICYTAPREAFFILNEQSDNIQGALISEIQNVLKVELEKINQIKNNNFRLFVYLRRESKPIIFSYTHGLKMHKGNCQRLVHGHRNTVEVFSEGLEDFSAAEFLIKECFSGNVHFSYLENIINKELYSELKDPSFFGRLNPIHNIQNIEIAYSSGQGFFSLSIPIEDVYVIPEETTIENLAKYFLLAIRSKRSNLNHLRVIAYEGIQKGSVFQLN